MMKTLIYFVRHRNTIIQIFIASMALRQVGLWALPNGQVTVLVFHTVGTTIDFDSILSFSFYLFKFQL